MKGSLRTNLIIGFCAVTIPMFIFLMYNNYYAMDVVRTQVGQSNKNLLSMYMTQIDSNFEAIDNYLYTFVLRNSDLSQISRNYPSDNETMLARSRTWNQMNADLVNLKNANMIFVYSLSNHDLLYTNFLGNHLERIESVKSTLHQYMQENEPAELEVSQWILIHDNEESALIRLVRTEFNQIVGVWVDVSNLLMPLSFLELGHQGQAFLVSAGGIPLTDIDIGEMNEADYRLMLPGGTELYSTLTMGIDYLLVEAKSQYADIHLAVLIPESILLQRLPYFQRLIFIIPLAGFMILVFYLILLQNVLLKPMRQLITGMRRIRQGDLETRLHNDKTREFMMINETFNGMVDQIQSLKINVYEEQIRTQQAEMRHLQVQINPHFLLNSINVIYNLAELKKYDVIKQMSAHLANYFRFITRTNKSMVTVAQEMKHIESYLEIQQLRFPQHLRYETSLEPGLEEAQILPLIIQPFVENAVIHGLQMNDNFFCIHVSVTRSKERPEDIYEVQVRDNGRGMDPSKLAKLQADSWRTDSADQHLGIWNVHRRLKLRYGDAAKLAFESGQPSGFVVRMFIPIEGGDDRDV